MKVKEAAVCSSGSSSLDIEGATLEAKGGDDVGAGDVLSIKDNATLNMNSGEISTDVAKRASD